MGRVGADIRRRACRFLTPALLLAIAGGAPAQQPDPPVFTADVRLVTLPVTVKDARGAPVGDLNRGAFTVLEDGEPRELAVFERHTNRPLAVALMVDVSLSTAIERRYERESAARFLANLLGPASREADRASVFSFATEVSMLSGFTRDQKALREALDKLRSGAGTSVYDAVLLASSELRRHEGRRVIVIITDGGDTTSQRRFADALRAAHDAEVAIYPLIVLPILSDAGRNRGGEHALITLARYSGGEAFVQHGTSNLDAAFGEVLRNLRTQYMLGFYPRTESEDDEDTFRKIEVRVDREGAAVMARSGYYADAPEDPPPAVRRTEGAPVSLRAPLRNRPTPEEDPEAPEQPTRKRRGKPDGPPRPPIVRPEP